VKELVKLGVVEEDITLIRVPGALEIPFALQQLASTEEYDALVAIGAVIRGETYHFEVVSNESASGIMQVSLAFDIPIANAVLTTENDEQTQARLLEKGTDAAKVAVEMANLRKEFLFEMDEE
jgi:6,7-dimethyl-8-ribityllumazine synthase